MVGKRRLRSAAPLGAVPAAGPGVCPLCERPLPAHAGVEEHHLVPRSHGGVATDRVHRICHRKIHATFTEKELARELHTWSALKARPELAEFVRWLQNKPPDFYRRTVTAHRKR